MKVKVYTKRLFCPLVKCLLRLRCLLFVPLLRLAGSDETLGKMQEMLSGQSASVLIGASSSNALVFITATLAIRSVKYLFLHH